MSNSAENRKLIYSRAKLMVLYCFSDLQEGGMVYAFLAFLIYRKEEWYLLFCFSHYTFLGVVLLVLASVISI